MASTSSSRPPAVARQSELSTASSAAASSPGQGASSPTATPQSSLPRTQAQPPRVQRLNTSDRASISNFLKGKSTGGRSGFTRFFLGRGKQSGSNARQGRTVRGGVEPSEDDDGNLTTGGLSDVDVEERADAPIRITKDELRRMNIHIGPDHADDPDRRKKDSRWAWDIMYENQFGIYLFGRAYYSSRLILPGGPTPFTLTPSAGSQRSTLTLSGSMGSSGPMPVNIGTAESSKSGKTGQVMSKAEWKQSQYLTSYTLDDKPLPNPDWQEVTPWMVNMEPGTDENGWQYNYGFRSKGWKSHAGTLGWGGWARRREWLKLIRFAPDDAEKSEPSPTESKAPPWATMSEQEAQKQREKEAEGKLKRICKHSTAEENLHALLKVLGKVPLDRRKLELWEEWLSSAESEEGERLDEVLHLPNALEDLRFAFTFSASFTDFLALLQKHGVVFKLDDSDEAQDHGSSSDRQLPMDPPLRPARPYTLTGP